MYREILADEVKVDRTLGYAYFIDRDHPLSSKGVGRVYYHRHLASIISGKWVSTGEVVHHKDGDKLNNLPSNLETLSASDHAILHMKEQGCFSIEITCPICGTLFSIPNSTASKRVTCSIACNAKHQTKWAISREDLEILIWNKSYVVLAKESPLSDVGIKKRAKSLGCKMPPPYFFNKAEEYRKEQRKLNSIPDLSTQQSSKLLA